MQVVRDGGTEVNSWMLPARPLIEHIRMNYPHDPKYGGEDGLRALCGTLVEDEDDPTVNVMSMERQLARVMNRVYITLEVADKICCRLLRIHPWEIYGDAYFIPMRRSDLRCFNHAQSFVKYLEEQAAQYVPSKKRRRRRKAA